MMPFFVKMKCRLMVPLTIFRSFEKGGEVYHNPQFAKHCDMENKFKSKIRLGMTRILYRCGNLLHCQLLIEHASLDWPILDSTYSFSTPLL